MRITNLLIFFFLTATVTCNSQTTERDIVLINTDTLDRKGIAEEVTIINSLHPKVIAIDLQFYGNKNYFNDNLLFLALDKCKNLVMIRIIGNYTGNDVEYKRFIYGSMPEFLIGAKTGFANTLIDDKFQTLRRFSIVENVHGDSEYNFAVRIAMAVDSLKAMNFVKSNPRIVDVDYRDGKNKFKTFSAEEVLGKKIKRADIAGKIVMMGFLGPGDKDKFFTPLNKRTVPAEPDMYGLEYFANIVVQVLKH